MYGECFKMVLFIWLLLLLLSSTLLLIRATIRNKHNPPGPPELPLIGNLHQLGSLPHRTLSLLSKRHGPVMFLRLGTVPTVVISSAEAARQILKVHDHDCCSRPPLVGPGRLSYNYLDMGFTPYGHHWREMRKLCAIELFSARKGRDFRHIREKEVSKLVSSIAQASTSASPVNLTNKSFALSASVLCKAAFGKAYEGSEYTSDRVHDMVEQAEEVLGCFFAADFFPYVGWIFDRISGAHGRLERVFRRLDEFFQFVIDDHIDPARKKPEKEDIVDVLLRIEGEQKQSVAGEFGKDHIKAMLMDIFLAGVNGSAVAIIWAMTELARNKTIMKKAQTEVRNLVGNKGLVGEEDIDKLQYLKMIIKETLRLHPPVPFLITRQVMSQFNLNGYELHPKTRVEVNVWAIGRDPEKWENPEEFFPERFSGSSVDYRGKDYELLPFGAGRRGCPGMDMGMVVVELALANLLCWFDWELPEGMEEGDVDVEEGPGLSCPKKWPLVLVPIKYQSLSQDEDIKINQEMGKEC